MSDEYITQEDVPCYQCLCLAMCRNKYIYPDLFHKCSIFKEFYINEDIGTCIYNWYITRDVVRGLKYEG